MLNVSSNGSIQLTRGDTARFSVSINNVVSDEDYVIKNEDQLTLSIKKRITDENPCVSKTVIGSSNFTIEPSDTSGLDFGNYIYDVQLTTESGDVYTVIPPTTFELLKEVTC